MIDKLPFLPDEHHYAITAVTARSAALDHMIDFTIAGLMVGRKNTAAFMLRQVGTDRLVNLLGALMSDIFPDRQDDITALISKIANLRRERNEVTHWLSTKTDDPTIAKFQNLRPFRNPVPAKLKSAADVEKISQGLLECTAELDGWLSRGNNKLTKDVRALALLETLVQQARRERLASLLAQDQPEMPEQPSPQLPPSQK